MPVGWTGMTEFESLLCLRDKIRQWRTEPLFMNLVQFAVALCLFDELVDEFEHFRRPLANSDTLYLLAELDFLIIAARSSFFDFGSHDIGEPYQLNLSRKQGLHCARIIIETTDVGVLRRYLGYCRVLC